MENKMTYAQAIDIALATMTDEVAIEKLNALKDKVSKKGGSVSKKVQAERKDFDSVVLQNVSSVGSTVSEILARMGNPDGVTSSKVTSSLGRLLKEGVVVNTKEKGKSYYSLA